MWGRGHKGLFTLERDLALHLVLGVRRVQPVAVLVGVEAIQAVPVGVLDEDLGVRAL